MTVSTTIIATNRDFDLRRIALDIPMSGFQDFITPWLITEMKTGRAILIDPGPACGLPSLKQALDSLGVVRLDLVLLTHIHVDHAGGVCHLLRAFPEALVAVHPKGMRHLADPAKLWASTVETLGKEVAFGYGEILPVPQENILRDGASVDGFEIVETEGHSQHHQSYLYHGGSATLLFEGEAAGVYLGDGYLRPATPPRFFYDTSTRSIAALKEVGNAADLALYGHFGCSEDVSHLLDAALWQMALWKAIAGDVATKAPRESPEILARKTVEILLKQDPRLAGLPRMPFDIQEREMYFLRNSAKGFIAAALEALVR